MPCAVPLCFSYGYPDPSLRVFSFSGAVGNLRKIGSSGDFADYLAVFAAPKRIGLKSHIRLSEVLVKSSSITSSDVSTHDASVSLSL
jgi:hypothetical protein